MDGATVQCRESLLVSSALALKTVHRFYLFCSTVMEDIKVGTGEVGLGDRILS